MQRWLNKASTKVGASLYVSHNDAKLRRKVLILTEQSDCGSNCVPANIIGIIYLRDGELRPSVIMTFRLICMVAQNIQQINKTGHSINVFVVTAVVLCASAGLAWLATASFVSFRRRVKGNSDEHLVKILMHQLSLIVFSPMLFMLPLRWTVPVLIRFASLVPETSSPPFHRRIRSGLATSTTLVRPDGLDVGTHQNEDRVSV